MKIVRNIILFLLLIPFAAASQSGGNDGNEYDLKTLFIYNFAKYFDWPAATESAHFKIAVLGKSDILPPLQKLSEQKKINNRDIEVKTIDNINDAKCQVLFIPKGMSDKLPECIGKLAGTGTLIITEGKNLASKGASVNFVMVDNKMKFEINQQAVRNAGLKVSNQLLDLAIVVK